MVSHGCFSLRNWNSIEWFLTLYSIPQNFFRKSKEIFPDVEFYEFNTPNAKKIDNNSIKIYWGNRINSKILDDLPNLEFDRLLMSKKEVVYL